MKKNSIELLSRVNSSHQQNPIGSESFPSAQQIQDYRQYAHNLRSVAFIESWKLLSGYAVAQWLKLKKFWQQRKAMAELNTLDSWILKDIGFSTADIEQLRTGSMMVEELNEQRANGLADRFAINKKVDLKLCQCNQKVEQKSLAENSTLAKCG